MVKWFVLSLCMISCFAVAMEREGVPVSAQKKQMHEELQEWFNQRKKLTPPIARHDSDNLLQYARVYILTPTGPHVCDSTHHIPKAHCMLATAGVVVVSGVLTLATQWLCQWCKRSSTDV